MPILTLMRGVCTPSLTALHVGLDPCTGLGCDRSADLRSSDGDGELVSKFLSEVAVIRQRRLGDCVLTLLKPRIGAWRGSGYIGSDGQCRKLDPNRRHRSTLSNGTFRREGARLAVVFLVIKRFHVGVLRSVHDEA